jgi:two-component system, OmpR family, response regulator RegX3
MEASISFPSATPPLVLIVDDEGSYREALSAGLSAEGFAVATAADGATALELFHDLDPDIVLLDVMLPDRPGTEVCREIRATSNTPVIMVSARDAEIDIVLGLELGATDYVAKPYRLRELIARIRTILRRQGADRVDEDVIEAGPVRMDAARRDVWVRGGSVELSRKEFDLLWLLTSNVGRVVTRETCIDTLWYDQDLLDTRTLDTHIKRLRRKVELDPAAPEHLVTIRGVGFRFDV